jgi:hypothetical protein
MGGIIVLLLIFAMDIAIVWYSVKYFLRLIRALDKYIDESEK